MTMLVPSILAFLTGFASLASSQKAGSFADGGNTKVSAMMMFLGNEEKVYIMDKAEGNAEYINGHPAWGAVWDIATHQTTLMDIKTNVFCASGMHFPNGSFMAFGGNGAIQRGGDPVPNGGTWDPEYQDSDGGKAIRILNPCTNSDNFQDSSCQWFDDPNALAMQKRRWYSTAEPLADGSVVLIGGFVNGGYINRNYPDHFDPIYGDGNADYPSAENTYEFFPSNGETPQLVQFLINTSGLNAYVHAFLLNSGKMLLQANYSTAIWDYKTNTETALPDMPGRVIRVYPASAAVAMLPLTPQNNWNPTILFCGGSDMPEPDWGNYGYPVINTWDYPASRDCQRLTPEPADGSAPQYQKDDDMLETRTMGQFIFLPDGKLLVVNGGLNGTAGYSIQTNNSAPWASPYGMSLASGPVGTPAIYDPNAPAGSRWSNAGFDTSNIPRLYHSSALLLPDGSVLIAGSNPNVDVNLTTVFKTEYKAEIFYPSYFSSSNRPVPQGVPKTISYGGDSFDITIPASSYSGSANQAAGNTTVALVRPGFTTHAMNMAQRYLQLNNTFTVNTDGSYVLHVAQAPNPYVLQPGPALLFVVVHGIPSNGTMVRVGSGKVEVQPTQPPSVLPPSVLVDEAKGSGSSSSDGSSSQNGKSSSSLSTGALVGIIVGGVAAVGLLGAFLFACLRRRKSGPSSYEMGSTGGMATTGVLGNRGSDTSAFMPLHQSNDSGAWSPTVNSFSPYKDDAAAASGLVNSYDAYNQAHHSPSPLRS